jgi:type I restriction enzyme R subunit
MFTSVADLRSKWSSAQQRRVIIEALEDKGISLEQLLLASKTPEADPFDLLCNLAFNAPVRSRRERAERLRKDEKEFLNKFKPEARTILSGVLDIEFGTTQLNDVNVLKVPPISAYGNVLEIAGLFGGPDELKSSLDEMQTLLYVM